VKRATSGPQRKQRWRKRGKSLCSKEQRGNLKGKYLQKDNNGKEKPTQNERKHTKGSGEQGELLGKIKTPRGIDDLKKKLRNQECRGGLCTRDWLFPDKGSSDRQNQKGVAAWGVSDVGIEKLGNA